MTSYGCGIRYNVHSFSSSENPAPAADAPYDGEERRRNMREAAPLITVVATHTIDRIPAAESPARDVPGGPAHYIGEALQRLGMPYEIISGELAISHVIPTPEGEAYQIAPLSLIPLPPRLAGAATILSPISREIDPEAVPPVEGLLALDLQGFVRVPGVLSNVTTGELVDLTGLIARAHLVKGGAHEIARLTPDSQEALEDVIVARTLGSKGAIIRFGGKDHAIPSVPVPAVHSIGAGDMYLACMVAKIVEGHDVLAAATDAARFTEGVLRQRRFIPARR